ncbi:hypothetical protein, partial [Enterobacter hormaechei]|uniref:hypothetical protein n=2 Tax=Gammaproteobacteria TaxID=1236 RepID=UPI0025A2F82B
NMSTQKSTKKSAPFQLRLESSLRDAMEKAQKQDGDESLAAWMKRIIRKELLARGIDPNN